MTAGSPLGAMRERLRRRPPIPLPGDGVHIEAVLTGTFYGPVAIGTDISFYGTEAGALLERRRGPPQPPTRRRPPPPPAPPAGFVGRAAERALTGAALRAGAPLEFHGPPGIGKSALLTRLAADAELAAGEDVVHWRVRRTPPEDLLAILFDALYDAGPDRVRPAPVHLRELLGAVSALIVLDDVEMDRDDLAEVVGAARSARVVLAGAEPRLWSGGRSERLAGLDDEAALGLVAGALGRPLRADEDEPARVVAALLEGAPLALLEAARRVRQEDASWSGLAEHLRGRAPPATERLSEAARTILRALERVEGAPLDPAALRAATGLAELGEALAELETRGLAERASPRYRAVQPAAPATGGELAGEEVDARLIEHFSARAHAPAARDLVAHAEVILLLLRRGLARGLWKETLRLGRDVEPAFLSAGRWAAWGEALGAQRTAAGALRADRELAWALHQLGTRALCRGERETARSQLMQALTMREEAGDEIGAALSRNNLQLLDLAPPPPPRGRKGSNGWARPWLLPGALAVLIGAGTATGLLILGDNGGGASPTIRVDPPGPVTLSASVARNAPIEQVTLRADGGDAPRLVVRRGGEQKGWFSLDASACPATLAAGASCPVRIGFRPLAATPTPARAVMVVRPRPGGPPTPVELVGNVIKPPPTRPTTTGQPQVLPVLEPAALELQAPPLGTARGSLVLRNDGGGAMTVGEAALTAGGAFQLTDDACSGTTVDAAGRCGIEIEFTPGKAGTADAFTDTLAIPVAGIGELTAPVTGTVVPDTTHTPTTVPTVPTDPGVD